MSKLEILDWKATFVDVGSERMHVSIGGGEVKVFMTFTSDLERLRDWLKSEGVSSVAMEATGVYWMPLYALLEASNIDVRMVDGRQIRRAPGRKSDMQDSQWGATLHAHGLLRSGFVPTADIRRLQDYVRLRCDHITSAGAHVQHMQKAMERMNIKLHAVISDLTGVSGLAVVSAILGGERNPESLLRLCHVQIRKNKADLIRESLRGTWTPEHLFALRQAFESWEHYQRQIAQCDQEIAKLLPSPDEDDPGPKRFSSPGRNAPEIDQLRGMMRVMCGHQDLTQLPTFTEYSVLQLIAETGTDLTRWPTEHHFASWAGLAPGSKQSGKRNGKVKQRRNKVGRLLCVMARSLARSKYIALGAYYRRLAARRSKPVAIIAVARKLATLMWRTMVKGLEYAEQGIEHYQQKIESQKLKTAQRLAKELGLELHQRPELA